MQSQFVETGCGYVVKKSSGLSVFATFERRHKRNGKK